MSATFFDKEMVLSPRDFLKDGGILHHLTGDEFPQTLLRETLRGSFMSAGRRHAFIYDGRLLAFVDGNETEDCPVALGHLRDAINFVRRRRELPERLPAEW